jgi:hypothetical protein
LPLFVVALTPSPKSHDTLVIDAPEMLGIIVNEIGDPAVVTFVEAARAMLTDFAGAVSTMPTIAAATRIMTMTTAHSLREMARLLRVGLEKSRFLNSTEFGLAFVI